MDFKKLHNLITEQKLPSFREKQIRQAFFCDLAGDWDEVTVLSKDLREKFKKEIAWSGIASSQMIKDVKSDSVKAVLELQDGNFIETVLIKHSDDRRTVCVSSQVGCPLACAFCATGKGGFKRNLESEEIIDQILFFARLLKKEDSLASANSSVSSIKSKSGYGEAKKVTNVVFMGMGEPLLNYDNVITAIKKLNDPEGFNLGARHFSISTCGVIVGIKKLAMEPLQVNLAFSLHAATNDLRSSLMVINENNNFKDVFRAIDSYIEKTNRRVMIEYLLISEINDKEEDAEALATLLQDRPLCYVNLIPYNEVENGKNKAGKFKTSTKESVDKFTEILKKKNIKFTIRHSFGTFIGAACGQLAGAKKK